MAYKSTVLEEFHKYHLILVTCVDIPVILFRYCVFYIVHLAQQLRDFFLQMTLLAVSLLKIDGIKVTKGMTQPHGYFLKWTLTRLVYRDKILRSLKKSKSFKLIARKRTDQVRPRRSDVIRGKTSNIMCDLG